MTACLVPQQIARYRAGELKTEAELLAIEEHLDGCAVCRQNLLAEISAAVPALRERLTSSVEAPACPEPTLLARCAEGRADATDIELVQTHCEDCPRCAQNLADRIAAQKPASTADSPAGVPVSVPRWRQRLRALSLPNGIQAHPGIAACALAGVAALAALLVYRGTVVLPLDARYRTLVTQQSGLQKQVRQERVYRSGLEMRLQESLQQRTEQETHLKQLDVRLQNLEARLSRLPRTTPADYSAQMLAAVEQAMATRRSEIDPEPRRVLALMETEQSQLRSGSADPSGPVLLQPAGTLILEDRPTLRWKPAAGAQNCTVTLRRIPDASAPDPNDEQKRANLTGTAWQVEKPLQRGRRYRWQVTTQPDGGVSAIGEFQIVDAQTAQILHRAAQEYSGQRLTLAVLYTKAGLLDAAETELTAILPTDPKFPIAHALLQNLHASRSLSNQNRLH